MAGTHPYTSSGPGAIIQAVNHLRKQFPATVNADTLKKLGIASGSEARVLNVLKFVGVLDNEGKKAANAGPIFAQHDDSRFQDGFSKLVKAAYDDLFNLHGEAAWALPSNQLISFFRSSDETSALVGQRQAITFQALAGLSGKADAPPARLAGGSKSKSSPSSAATKAPANRKAKPVTSTPSPTTEKDPVHTTAHPVTKRLPAIHIDVQVHISPDTSPEQIDRIFASMAKHLGAYIS